jgi:dynein heavy chain
VNRKHAADKWALDDVVMSSEVTHPPKDFENLREAASEGVFVYGLFLDGCAWHGKENRLVDSEPKKLNVPLPVLYVTGVQVRHTKSIWDQRRFPSCSKIPQILLNVRLHFP